MNIFKFGIDKANTSSDIRRILLMNKLSLIFALILFIFSGIFHFKMHLIDPTIILFSSGVALLLIPFLNKLGLYKFTGVLTSIIIPIAVVAASTLTKINTKEDIDLVTYIGPRIFLLSTIALPLIIINFKNYFSFYFAVFINFFAFVGFGLIQKLSGLNIADAVLNPNTIFIVDATSLLSFLAIFISFFNFQKNNYSFEKSLNEQNVILQEKTKEAEEARLKLEASTEKIRAQAALSEILRNVTGKERSTEKFLNDALNKLLDLNWLGIIPKGTITLIKNDKEEVIAERFFDNDTNIEEIKQPLIIDKTTFGNLTLFKEKGKQLSEFQKNFISSVADTLASVINRKNEQTEIKKIKDDLEEKNKHIRKYLVQLEQQGAERESLNQMILAQKKQVEEKNKQVQIQRDEVEQYAKQLEKQSLEQEKVTQELFAQKLEVEQRNYEVEQYAKQLEEQAKEQEVLNQKLFAQKLEVEQRNMEVELYTKKLEDQAKEQEKLNQQVFAQKLEVEQRNMEVEQYATQLEQQAKEQEKLNQELFAQKMEVEQRNMEVVQYMNMLEEQSKEQEVLNQRLFAQSLEVEQKSFEIERYSKEVEVLKEKAEGTLKHLNDSINYSKYIQDSLLPLDSFLEENIPGEYFVYYKPKETIGGDFYYVNRIEDYLILAVADCTGHGVPGALITMLGITFLNDIVERNLVENTGEALNFLRKRIKTTFRSYGSNLQNKNGLDISLCAIDLKTNLMQFSGAFNPLFIFRDDELMEFKATRNPIGYYPVEKDFETIEIQLQKDDIIYLFSDGYSDQVGGPKGRKFSKRQFKDFLHEIHTFPMIKQSVFVDKIMQKWMGTNPQVDDMTIMGIRWDNLII